MEAQIGGAGNNDMAFTPLDGELSLASHWVFMKRFVILAACICFGANLSGCISYKPLSPQENDRRTRKAELHGNDGFDWGEHDDLFDWDRD